MSLWEASIARRLEKMMDLVHDKRMQSVPHDKVHKHYYLLILNVQ